MFGLIAEKNWYVLDGVHYSVGLRYFKENQLEIIEDDGERIFKSKEEDKIFLPLKCGTYPKKYMGMDLDETIQTLHNDLLDGEFGWGNFTN